MRYSNKESSPFSNAFIGKASSLFLLTEEE